MKSLIVYYSYSGNTQKVAQVLKEELQKRGETDIFKLEPEDEAKSFIRQALRAFTKTKARIKQAPYDISGYDLVCIGSPVWAFAPAPSINTYISGLKNIQGKDALCFVTYGSGLGVSKCLDYMNATLEAKGTFKIYDLKIQQLNTHDEGLIRQAIGEVVSTGL